MTLPVGQSTVLRCSFCGNPEGQPHTPRCGVTTNGFDPHYCEFSSDIRAELVRLRLECSTCEKCGHVQAEPNWCHECGHRVSMPIWAGRLLAERDRLRKALEEIAEETGTPYGRIAQEALDG